METKDQSYQLNIIRPWEIDLDAKEHKWTSFFIRDRRMPDFIFSEPSELTKSRIDLLVTQFTTKSRRWVILFSDSVTYIRQLSTYVAATFVLSTGLPAEVKGPNELIDYAFTRYSSTYLTGDHPIEACSLLIIPYFDPGYPGYIKARPKIVELLTDRKMQKRPFMFSLYTTKLPTPNSDMQKYSAQLLDFFGSQSRDLFTDRLTKFLILRGE